MFLFTLKCPYDRLLQAFRKSCQRHLNVNFMLAKPCVKTRVWEPVRKSSLKKHSQASKKHPSRTGKSTEAGRRFVTARGWGDRGGMASDFSWVQDFFLE